MTSVPRLLPLLALALAACEAPMDDEMDGRDALAEQREAVRSTIATFKARDPGLERLFETAHGYAVLPRVRAGGAVIGGAHGEGLVFERGRLVGRTELTRFTLGAQLGAQTMSEVLFFEQEHDLREFQEGDFELGASASAIAVDEGAAAAADFDEGVAVFVMAREGLMAAATIGGQEFDYWPIDWPMDAPMGTSREVTREPPEVSPTERRR